MIIPIEEALEDCPTHDGPCDAASTSASYYLFLRQYADDKDEEERWWRLGAGRLMVDVWDA